MEPEVVLETVEREEAPAQTAASAVPPEASPVEASAAAPGDVPDEESPAAPGVGAGQVRFDLRIAAPLEGGPALRLAVPDEASPAPPEARPVEGSRELPVAAASEASLALQFAAPLEEIPEPQGPSLEDLSQEIRRVGRELFKTNRAAERNQELFESTLGELRQLSAAVAQVHAQTADPVFLAKAALCRELLGVADALEASLAAAKEMQAQLRAPAEEPARGIAFRFPATQRQHAGLAAAVEAMGKWVDGQQLLYERLMAALQAAGVRAIESVGRSFDPALHRAVSVESRRDVPAGTVVGEELKGYSLDGKVLRFGEVVVARE
jgi:molecular chaperone GrpE (heat shock protein)